MLPELRHKLPCMYVCMYACMHACMYASMYVCIYVCICVPRAPGTRAPCRARSLSLSRPRPRPLSPSRSLPLAGARAHSSGRALQGSRMPNAEYPMRMPHAHARTHTHAHRRTWQVMWSKSSRVRTMTGFVPSKRSALCSVSKLPCVLRAVATAGMPRATAGMPRACRMRQPSQGKLRRCVSMCALAYHIAY